VHPGQRSLRLSDLQSWHSDQTNELISKLIELVKVQKLSSWEIILRALYFATTEQMQLFMHKKLRLFQVYSVGMSFSSATFKLNFRKKGHGNQSAKNGQTYKQHGNFTSPV